MNSNYTSLGNVNHDEFDSIVELIIAILFMAFGITATVMMIRIMDAKTQIQSRVDKVEVNYKEVEDNNPFYFTGYEAYMFGWMLDTTADQSITWSNNTGSSATIDPITQSNNFVTVRNRLIRSDVASEMASGFADQNEQIELWKGNSTGNYALVYTNAYNEETEGKQNKWVLQLIR